MSEQAPVTTSVPTTTGTADPAARQLSVLEAQRERAAQQLEVRLRYGDQVWELREVDHFAVFSRRSRARRAGRALVASGFEIAISRHQQIAQLESEIAELGERFETRKRVDRAKGLLQTNMGLSEPEAFRWIQKTSMDRRLTMREVADAVVDQLGGPKD